MNGERFCPQFLRMLDFLAVWNARNKTEILFQLGIEVKPTPANIEASGPSVGLFRIVSLYPVILLLLSAEKRVQM